MSAAPVVTAAFSEATTAYDGRVAKRARVRHGGPVPAMEVGSCAEQHSRRGNNTSDFASHVANLREQFTSVSEALVSSILESTGNQPDEARCLISQILAANPQRTDRPWAKRRRSLSPDEDESVVPSSPPSPPRDKSQLISHWIECVMRRLHGARTQDDVTARLRPAVEELLQHHQSVLATTGPRVPDLSTQTVQKILSRAILSQTDKIANLESSVQTRNKEVEELQRQLADMEDRVQQSEELNKKLRRDNGWLYHFIRCQYMSTNDKDSSHSNGFEDGFQGPGVY